MKLAALTTVAALLVAPAVSAADLGGGMSAGGEISTELNTDTGVFALKVMPKVGMAVWGVNNSLTANFDLMGIDNSSTIDTFQGLDYKATMPLGFDGMSLFGKISSDGDLKFGETTIGLSFAF